MIGHGSEYFFDLEWSFLFSHYLLIIQCFKVSVGKPDFLVLSKGFEV